MAAATSTFPGRTTRGILEVQRTVVSYNFGTGSSGSPTLTGTLTNVGNQAVTGSNTVTNTTNFAVVAGSSNGCAFSSSILGAQAIGNACTFTANFVGGGSGSSFSDVLTYLPAVDHGQPDAVRHPARRQAVGTTTTIGGQTPLNPSYSSQRCRRSRLHSHCHRGAVRNVTAPSGNGCRHSGFECSITHPTLTASGTNPVGVATVTVALSGLTATGAHTISAIYSDQRQLHIGLQLRLRRFRLQHRAGSTHRGLDSGHNIRLQYSCS